MKQQLLTLLALIFISAGAWAQQNTLIVDGVGTDTDTYATIKDAIGAASTNDVIEVATDTYTLFEPLDIDVEGLTLRNKEGFTPVIQACTGIGCPGDPELRKRSQTNRIESPGLINVRANDITLEGFIIKGTLNLDQGPLDIPNFMYGLYVFNSTGTSVSNNKITGFFAGLVIERFVPGKGNPSFTYCVDENNITENIYGIAVLWDDYNAPIVNIKRNNITDHYDAGILLLSFSGSDYKEHDITININENNIFGNEFVGLLNDTNEDIDATCNWWGTTDLDEIEAQIEGGGHVEWFPFSGQEDGPCLHPMFKLQIGTGQQNDR